MDVLFFTTHYTMNPLNEQQERQLKDKIVEAVPEIMELKFGCRIQWIQFKDSVEDVVHVYGEEDQLGGVQTLGKYYSDTDRIHNHYQREDFDGQDGFEILGRPITLEDILVALQNTKEWNQFDVTLDNEDGVAWISQEFKSSAKYHLNSPFDSEKNSELRAYLFTLFCYE